MPKNFKPFFLWIFILSMALAFIGFLVKTQTAYAYFPSNYLFLIGFYFLVTSGAHLALLKANETSGTRFVAYFMAITGIKLFVLLGFLGVYVFFNREGAIPFIAAFGLLYLIYTVIELVFIVKEVKNSGQHSAS